MITDTRTINIGAYPLIFIFLRLRGRYFCLLFFECMCIFFSDSNSVLFYVLADWKSSSSSSNSLTNYGSSCSLFPSSGDMRLAHSLTKASVRNWQAQCHNDNEPGCSFLPSFLFYPSPPSQTPSPPCHYSWLLNAAAIILQPVYQQSAVMIIEGLFTFSNIWGTWLL